MRVNLDWLREWVDVDLDAAGLADVLTTAGLEVDSVEPVAGTFSGVVVAEVLGCVPHPNADRLRLCEVSDGQTTRTVVCGAPNVRAGLKVAFARIGAILPGARKIEAASIRGASSEGMLCSASELALSEEASGIVELPDDAPLGADLRAYLALDDHVLDIDLTPNRGDCFSVIGIAREVSAALGVTMRSSSVEPVAAVREERFGVEIAAEEGCPRFAGRVIRSVATGRSSPAWLVERLRRAGLRAINPIVDVTNYVMLELGQPLHSYDLAKLDGEIVVRWAEDGETLNLLDGRSVELAKDVVVISDRSGAIGLAGIMGGASTAVDGSTADVFLEAAYFPPQAVAGRARRYGLHTDASLRFERGVDPEGQARAIERATALLVQIAGGEPGPVAETVAENQLPTPVRIHLRGERVTAVIGQELPPETIEETLGRLGMSVIAEGPNAWQVTPPSFRFDLAIEEDLIEEVARLVGYDNIPAVPEFTVSRLGRSTEERIDAEAIEDLLVARGYSQIITYSFIEAEMAELIDPGARRERLANPLSQELAVMRGSLWPGLLGAAAKNLSRQQERLRLFEVGTQFEADEQSTAETAVVAGLACGPCWPEHWDTTSREVDFFDVKGDLESIVALTGCADEIRFSDEKHAALRPGRSARVYLGQVEIGWLGEVHPAVQRRLDLKKAPILFSLSLEEITLARLPAYQPYSKFPSLRRDLAVLVPNGIAAEEIVRCVRASAGSSLQNVNIFDVYRGPGIDSSRKSIGLGLILQDTYRTLTDEDADRTVATVVEHLGSELGATIRT